MELRAQVCKETYGSSRKPQALGSMCACALPQPWSCAFWSQLPTPIGGKGGGANFQFYPLGQITSHLGACYCSWHGGILLNEIMYRQGLISVSPGLLGAYSMETSFFHRASRGDALIPSDTPLLQSTHALCATCIFSSSPLVFHTHPRSHPNAPSFLGRSWRGEVLPFRHLESSRLVLHLAAVGAKVPSSGCRSCP